MTIKQIVSFIAKKEGKLSQVSIGNIREIVGIISDLLLCSDVVSLLIKNGQRRSKKK